MSSLTQIFILGGTGRVGQNFIAQALSQGQQVTALVRRPNALPPSEDLFQVVGSPVSSYDILNALISISERSSSQPKTQITIVSTLGQTRANPSNPWSAPTSPAFFMSQSAQAVVDALRLITSTPSSPTPIISLPTISVSKFIVLGAFGTAESWSYMSWLFRFVFRYSSMRQTIEDHDRIVDVIRENFSTKNDGDNDRGEGNKKLQVPTVVVRPVMLKFDEDKSGEEAPAVKEWGNGSVQMGFMPTVNWRSVVAFLMERVEDQRLDGEMPVISN